MTTHKRFYPVLVLIFSQSAFAAIITGAISLTPRVEQPLVLTETNQLWQRQAIIDMPFTINLELNDMACSHHACHAVGFYAPFNSYTVNVPLVISGRDDQWHFVKTFKNMPHVSYGAFTSIACTNTTCIAGGYYDHPYDFEEATLLVRETRDGWRANHHITEPDDLQNSAIFAMACNKTNQCFAVGDYVNAANQQLPLLLRTQDNGESWQYTAVSDTPRLQGMLRSIVCQLKTCIAVGSYHPHLTYDYYLPLLVRTTNGGVTWTEPAITNADETRSLALTKLKCYATTCIAIGTDTTKRGNMRPIAFISRDLGASWQKVIAASGANNHSYIELNDVGCDHNHCFIAGIKAITSTHSEPVLLALLIQQNRVSMTDIKLDTLTDNDERFDRVHCHNGECIVMGSKRQTTPDQSVLVYSTRDDGQSWQRISQIEAMPVIYYSRLHASR